MSEAVPLFDPSKMHEVLRSNGRLLLCGLDTLKETFNLHLKGAVVDYLQAQKELAEEVEYDGTGTFLLGDESAHMTAPTRGVKFFIRLDGFDIVVRHMPDWSITVAYSSVGLWQSGVDLLRDRALSLLLSISGDTLSMVDSDGVVQQRDNRDWQRVSEVHVAVDFHSEKFSNEMGPGFERCVVMHAGTKRNTWGAGDWHSTLTLGSKASAQIQVYDKGLEIREASGKTWFKELWEREGGKKLHDLDHIWRVEMRLFGDWLKDRGVYTFDQFVEKAVSLLQDCLWHRRLTEPTNDSHRDRWPMHWLWQATMLAVCGQIIARPLGIRLTRDTEPLPEQLRKTAAGVIRAAAAAHKALYFHDRRDIDEIAREIGRDVMALLFQDKRHGEKTAQLFERYRRIALPR